MDTYRVEFVRLDATGGGNRRMRLGKRFGMNAAQVGELLRCAPVNFMTGVTLRDARTTAEELVDLGATVNIWNERSGAREVLDGRRGDDGLRAPVSLAEHEDSLGGGGILLLFASVLTPIGIVLPWVDVMNVTVSGWTAGLLPKVVFFAAVLAFVATALRMFVPASRDHGPSLGFMVRILAGVATIAYGAFMLGDVGKVGFFATLFGAGGSGLVLSLVGVALLATAAFVTRERF